MIDRPNDVSYELGGIKQSLETITRTLSENRLADAQYRTGVRENMEKQRDSLTAVANDMALAKKDIADMKPTVESLEQRALMSAGAAKLAVILGKFAHVVSAALGAGFVFLLERWLK